MTGFYVKILKALTKSAKLARFVHKKAKKYANFCCKMVM